MYKAGSVITSKIPADRREDKRRIPVKGAENFRDLGGYLTTDGRRLKWGVLYRAGHLHNLTPRGLECMEKLNIRHVVDFRGPSERESKPDQRPSESVYSTYPVDVAGTDLIKRISAVIRGESEFDLEDYMLTTYRSFVAEYTETFGSWIRDLARRDHHTPQIIHCTAGKDRTGYAAAILLRTLGVPIVTVVEDYMKTNVYLAGFIDKSVRKIRRRTFFRNDGEFIRPLLGVQSNYLEESMKSIESKWGGFDNFVSGGLGLSGEERETLRYHLTE